MLEIRLLGGFEVRVDGVPQAIPSRPAQSLLAYLVLHPGSPQRRELLAGLLWPDHPEIVARRNLRAALWHVRKALSGGRAGAEAYIASDGIAMAFVGTSEYWLDTAALEAGTAAASGGRTGAELIDLVSLYRGELLPGFYDDWAILERERVEGVFASGMQQLLGRLLVEERWDDVLVWSGRWIALGHAPEPAYRASMAAHAGLGDLSGAAETLLRCRSALDEELGVEPSEQTRSLYESIRRGAPVADLLGLAGFTDVPIRASPGATLPSEPGEPPFQGLQCFEEADAGLFFGREDLARRLAERVLADGLLFVVGASGIGKSSLVRAGLIPALRRAGLAIRLVTPTGAPLQALASALARAHAGQPANFLADAMARDPQALRRAVSAQPVALVVDQFEEVFTLCRGDAERKAYIDNLLSAAVYGEAQGAGVEEARPAASGGERRVCVVIALRADFYASCSAYANLRSALAQSQAYIGPLTAAQLRRAIEEPARSGGWSFEPGLVDLILQDMGDEPGALPLLSHALLETWLRRSGRRLTLSGYVGSGGVRAAIARTAERVYRGLTSGGQAAARAVFMSLTEPGEGMQDIRRRAAYRELLGRGDPDETRAVLDTMAAARLITLDSDGVEMAHEALIREWPTLRGWLAEDREGLRLHRRLGEAARSWADLGRDASELYRGARLAQAAEWAARHDERLNPLERDFLLESQALADREARERREAGARDLAAAAVADLNVDPERSILLAQRAVSLTYEADGACLPEALTALHEALAASHVRVTLRAGFETSDRPSEILCVAFDSAASGERLATASAEGAVTLWEVATGRRLLTLRGHGGAVNSVAFSPDGGLVASGSDDHTVRISSPAAGGPTLLTIPCSGRVTWVTFSPDGARLACADDADGVKVWRLVTGRSGFSARLEYTIDGPVGEGQGVAFSPDGTRIVTGAEDTVARVWDVTTGEMLLAYRGHTAAVRCVAFSPDGSRVASVGFDVTARVWEVATGREIALFAGHHLFIFALAWHPDGRRVATASFDGTARVWDAVTGREYFALAGQGNLGTIAFNARGTLAATGGPDGTARIWSVLPGEESLNLAGHEDRIWCLAFSRDGKYLATAGYDGTARLWDVSSGRTILTLAPADAAGTVFAVAFSPDGKRLAAAYQDGLVRVWDVATGRETLTLAGHARPQAIERMAFAGVIGVAFSPNGRLLASAGADCTARLWDAATGRERLVFGGHQGRVNRVAFNPDGTRLATSSDDSTARVWDTATGEELFALAGHTARVWDVEWAPDGRRLATGSTDNTARLWDAGAGTPLFTLAGHRSTVGDVAFSPDGSQVATAGGDSTTRLWDAGSGGERLVLHTPGQSVSAVVFTPDGKRLATAGSDAIVRFYLMDVDQLLALAARRVTRSLTPEECRRYLRAAPDTNS